MSGYDLKPTIDKFSEWQQAHEEQAFKKSEAFVSSDPPLEVSRSGDHVKNACYLV